MNQDSQEIDTSTLSDYLDFAKNVANVERQMNDHLQIRKSVGSQDASAFNKENKSYRPEISRKSKNVNVF